MDTAHKGLGIVSGFLQGLHRRIALVLGTEGFIGQGQMLLLHITVCGMENVL